MNAGISNMSAPHTRDTVSVLTPVAMATERDTQTQTQPNTGGGGEEGVVFFFGAATLTRQHMV